LIKSDEDLKNFVTRRINENIKINKIEKINNTFPILIFIKKIFGHINNLFEKIFAADDMSEIKSLIVKRIEKLFGKTVILNKEKKNYTTFVNSPKNHEKIKNIRPLQSAAGNLSNKEIIISLNIFFESIKYVKSWSKNEKILIAYIPSPITSYVWSEPISYEDRNKQNGTMNQKIKETTNEKNYKKSIFIRSKINEFTKKNNINFIDFTDLVINKAENNLLHGPLDWRHFNYLGYKNTSDYLSIILKKSKK
tara:strand:+ start:468 stop:1220 length:753 start_codon:yes stop_codon:yes gene_type:complete